MDDSFSFKEKMEKCGFTENEAKRFMIIANELDAMMPAGAYSAATMHFVVYCVEKLVERFGPKLTEEEIVKLHKHL